MSNAMIAIYGAAGVMSRATMTSERERGASRMDDDMPAVETVR